MDGKFHEKKQKNPREGANQLSTLLFWYTARLFWTGYRRDLNVNDLYEPLKEHSSHRLGERIAALWEEECQRVKRKNELCKRKNSKHNYDPSLLRVLLRLFGVKLMLYGICLVLTEILLRVSQPLFLAELLKYFMTDAKVTKQEAYIYASLIIFCSALYVLIMHQYTLSILHLGMKMRVACCSLIYRKSLKLSRTSLGATTIGQAVNLMSNDVSRFDVAILFIHQLWVGPLETIVVMYLMYQHVQESAIIGVAALLLFIPLQIFLGGKSSSYRMKTALRTDERVRLTNEILTGIQAIKMYTWEKPFVELIAWTRSKEISVIRGMSYIRGVTMSVFMFSTRLTLYITLLSFVLLGNKINAEIVFVITAYCTVLRTNMTIFFPQGITQVAEAMISIQRLKEFMLYDESLTRADRSLVYRKDKDEKIPEKKSSTIFTEVFTPENGHIKLSNATAKWLPSDRDNTLSNINLDINPGELIAIVGQVGAGKSSLLNVILKELSLTSGTIQVSGQIAFASQEPWLFAGTVRQNILFGRKINPRKYEEVVEVCQLKRDFKLLPYGDKTIVGERGISLSGGQRARINLARAVYSDAPNYIFDDPLSAVDAHVGKHIFEECIFKYLKHKTRILVTHQLQYLTTVDKIIVLKDGAIHSQGSFDELVQNGVDFIKSLECLDEKTQSEEKSSVSSIHSSSLRESFIEKKSVSFLSSSMANENIEDPKGQEENQSSGSVGGWVYKGYFKSAGSCCTIFFVVALFLLSQFFASSGDYFVSEWARMEENSTIYENGTYENANGWKESLTRSDWIYIYTAITALTIIITLLRSSVFFNVCMRASRNLHNNMFSSVCRATMHFFNTNTSGRILNRFSKDLGQVDELLPVALIDVLQYGLSLLGIIVVVAITNPWLIIPTVIICLIFWWFRVVYVRTGRSVKRLEGITRSPVFSHLSASLQGLPTIRAFDADEILINEFDRHQDLHSSAWYIFISTSRAFGFYLDAFCVLYIALVTGSFFLDWMQDSDGGKPDGGTVGLAITQSIGLTGIFQWTMRQSTELENQMTSVERILEYSKLPSEPPLESTLDKKPRNDWPDEGCIKFRNVHLRYSPLDPPVLKNLNFVVFPKEKIGIVGRTGAGKSSLIQLLFRLAEIQGDIEIDGINTGDIGLHDLRRHISIIPQEPFLFSGNLRKNLDPFNQSEDVVLWRALEEVELKDMGLDDPVSEGGSNMSVGQRQLVCLARAIVKNNPILVLDEATANVDPKTDELIQKTIRTKFKNCTVLTIAHRLNTVIDSDRILVMDAGTNVEFDHPFILLKNEFGYLRSMVNETGRYMAETLMRVAENTYKTSSTYTYKTTL